MDLVKVKHALLLNNNNTNSVETIAALKELDTVVVPGWAGSTPTVLTRLEVLMVGRNKLSCLLTVDNVYVEPYYSYRLAVLGQVPSQQLLHCHYAEDITHSIILKNRFSNGETRNQILFDLTGRDLSQVPRVTVSKNKWNLFDENAEKFTFQPIT